MAGGAAVIEAGELRDRLAGLEPIGLGADGTTRLAWTEELAAAEGWFGEQARAGGLRVERDPAGSLWALPEGDGPWWATGSHLDSVRRGGRFDGALGVAAGFAAAERVPGVAVIAFADEEGARFNTPTFGSRALAGRLADGVLDRVDDGGVPLREAMSGFGVDVSRLGEAPSWLGRLRGFVELHIDQTQDLARLDAPAGSVRSLAARMRLALRFAGRADHAGTTRRSERRDALAAAARVIVAADELAADDDDFMVTASRMLVEPNAFTTVPSEVRLWIDARSPDGERLIEWKSSLEAAAQDTGIEVAVGTASHSDAVEFDPAVREAFGSLHELVCFAGHDAGILAPRIPAGMVFVRNATGVSHSPDEHVELDDAAVATEALRNALERLVSRRMSSRAPHGSIRRHSSPGWRP
jgi:N-carbamoyl-L-amino-acid hydrolase